jgi:hypothetical protein
VVRPVRDGGLTVFSRAISEYMHIFVSITLSTSGVGSAAIVSAQEFAEQSSARYLDSGYGRDWPGYGRTFGQQHYSPLAQISPSAAERARLNLRHGWGVRGIAWWNGKTYTGTTDGRLIATDAKNGRALWSVQTFVPKDAAYINGAPRVFDGKVIIGFAGSVGVSRGYVTAYEAETGRNRHCVRCHGASAIAVIQAPDLRRSGIVLSAQAFTSIVRDGELLSSGMPAFGELTDQQLTDLRQYIRTEAQGLRRSVGYSGVPWYLSGATRTVARNLNEMRIDRNSARHQEDNALNSSVRVLLNDIGRSASE